MTFARNEGTDLEGHLESDVVDEVKCGACGAQQTLGGATFSGHCGFCGTAIVAQHMNALMGSGDGELDSSAVVKVVDRMAR